MNKDIHSIFEQYEDVLQTVSSLPKPKSKIQAVTQWDKNDLDKSHVQIPGYGILTLGQLKENTAAKLEDLAGRIRKNEPKFVATKLYERHGVLLTFIKTLVQVEKDIEYMRRAGQLPGLIKREL
ncbi:MAG: hypothetical protein EBU90_18975 [Proteobacteria bacterium]|nr:hypothetical protein [Pseudomonadota bacterium]NBP15499.1 hypothetical protein [bacterium]